MTPTARNLLLLSSQLDPDARAFASRSGATDVRAISAFVKGVKSLGLWNSLVCWPMRSAQNAAGSSTTAFSLGGLETTNATLVGGPTWGANGITTGAAAYVTAAYGRTLTSTPLTLFCAYTGLTATLNQTYVAMGRTTSSGQLVWVDSMNSGSVNLRGFARNDASTALSPSTTYLSSNGSNLGDTNTIAVPSSGMVMRSHGWLGTEGAVTMDNVTCGGALRTTFGSPAAGTYAIYGYATTSLTNAQVAEFYSLYKLTLGAGLGLP